MTRLLCLILFLSLSWACATTVPDNGASIDGTWRATEAELGGVEFAEDATESIQLVVVAGTYTVTVGDATDKGRIKLDPLMEPKWLEITGTSGPNTGRTIYAIYEKSGDRMRICYDLSGKARPGEFRTAKGTKLFLVSYEREEPAER